MNDLYFCSSKSTTIYNLMLFFYQSMSKNHDFTNGRETLLKLTKHFSILKLADILNP